MPNKESFIPPNVLPVSCPIPANDGITDPRSPGSEANAAGTADAAIAVASDASFCAL